MPHVMERAVVAPSGASEHAENVPSLMTPCARTASNLLVCHRALARKATDIGSGVEA